MLVPLVTAAVVRLRPLMHRRPQAVTGGVLVLLGAAVAAGPETLDGVAVAGAQAVPRRPRP